MIALGQVVATSAANRDGLAGGEGKDPIHLPSTQECFRNAIGEISPTAAPTKR